MERRDRSVRVRVTDQELEAIKQAAQVLQMDVSDLIRSIPQMLSEGKLTPPIRPVHPFETSKT